MKKLLLWLLFLPCAMAGAQATGPVITWEKSAFDFGDIVQGEKVEHTFKFRNSGNAPLVITNVQVTCGCTTPKGWDRDPILPGQSSELTISFNSSGKYGRQEKVVTVVSNAINPEGSQVLFSANVVEKKTP
ncbi:MAG: DUF1573 domain-containing protein [Cyclobacteriaceae bacterium]|nr:DUF1573 domain-containing protein [Cyclobacteriaceae bacterium]